MLVFEYQVEIRAGRVFSLRSTLLEAELIAPSDLSSAFAPLYNRHMMGCTRFFLVVHQVCSFVDDFVRKTQMSRATPDLPQESV